MKRTNHVMPGVDKFPSRRPIFRARNFSCIPDWASRKTDSQNQSARRIEKQLETLIFALCYLGSTYNLHF